MSSCIEYNKYILEDIKKLFIQAIYSYVWHKISCQKDLKDLKDLQDFPDQS